MRAVAGENIEPGLILYMEADGKVYLAKNKSHRFKWVSMAHDIFMNSSIVGISRYKMREGNEYEIWQKGYVLVTSAL